MKNHSGKKLFMGIILMLTLTLMLGLASVAYALTDYTPVYLNMKYPVQDDTALDITKPANVTDCWTYVYRINGSEETLVDLAETPMERNPHMYKLYVYLRISAATYNEPKTTGWGIVLKEEGTGYEYKLASDKAATVTKEMSGSTLKSYRVSFACTFQALRKADDITYDLVYGNSLSDLEGLKEGDSPIFDVKIKNDTYFSVGQVKWYGEEDTTMKNPLAYSEKLVGGKYYRIVIPIQYTKNRTHYNDGDFFNSMKLDPITLNYYLEEKYVSSEKTCYVTLYPITVKRKVETMNITGIKTPTAGNKPDVTGITISTKESNALHPFKFIVDSTKVKWEGTFDKYGNFKSNTGYTLVIPYQPDYGGEFYDFDTEKGFAATKISSNIGTVESDAWTDTITKVIKINFTVPKDIYTVTFDPNGGTGTMDKVAVEEGSTYKLPACTFTAPAGRVFDKWDKGTAGEMISVTESITVKALWKDKPVEYKVTFAPGEGSGTMAGVTIEKDEWCVLPECEFTAPAGKVFDKWDKGMVNAKFKVSADTTVTALWKALPPETWKISFAAGGGSGEMAATTVNKGDKYTLPNCSFTAPAGKIFDKWDKGTAGAQIDITADTTVTAQWKDKPVETCKVTFAAGGGSGEMAAVTVSKGDKITLPACDFIAAEGKEFDKWDKGAVGAQIDITADTTVTALWKDKPIEKCTITFAANGGSGEMEAATVVKGSEYTLPECPFTAPEGNVFDGWDKGTPGMAITVDSDLVVTATWKAKPIEYCTVTFAPNGGSGEMAASTVVKGDTLFLPECGFTAPDGNVFDTWDKGIPGAVITVDSDLVVTAVWKANPVEPVETCKIQFAANGGSGTMEIVNVNKGAGYVLPPCGFTPKAGKEFDTWDYGDPGTEINVTKDLIVVAQWKDLVVPVDQVTVKNGIYKLSGSTATLIGTTKNTLTSLTIQDTVKANGKKYKVTAIAASACEKMSKLAKVTIGKYVKNIGKKAFYNCKKLKTITIKSSSLTSSSVKADAFKKTYSKATVKVPSKKLAAYKKILVKRGISKKATFKKK